MSIGKPMIKTFEELSMNACPALQTKLYDGWILRFANGYLKRSNSVNPIYYSTLPLTEKIEFCQTEYLRRDLPVIFKITGDSYPRQLDTELEKRKYRRFDETALRVLPMNDYRYRKPDGILIENEFSEDWFRVFFSCSKSKNELWQRTARDILHNIPGKVVVVRKQIDNESVGCGYGAIERGYAGVYNIIVAENHRGKGYGLDIMDAILGAATNEGTKEVYLSVVVGNTPAENLYQKLGFNEIYRYWYRIRDLKRNES